MFGAGPAGVDRVWSAAPSEGVARNLVAALRFRHQLAVAELMADRIQWLAPAHILSGVVVPVPPARSRLRRRGFDPAGELATALAERIEAPLVGGLLRRVDRRNRPSATEERTPAPRITAAESAPRGVVLVDDVLDAGALVASAEALRTAGATGVVAVTFARRL